MIFVEDAMELPPPKFRKLPLVRGEENDGFTNKDVWEIGVRPKDSLYWSIVMSYLLSSGDKKLSRALKQLTGSQEEMKTIKKELNIKRINIRHICAKWKSLVNPFKNRYVVFRDRNMKDVFRIFKIRLNEFSRRMGSKSDPRNYELELKAASKMLDCNIEVYFPNEPNHDKLVYSTLDKGSSIKPTIFLFQYKDQEHGQRKENIDIFRFAMNVEYAHLLKLHAMVHWLKMAKISNFIVKDVRKLMRDAALHGNNFLTTILQTESIGILPDIYRSPYIAVKLSEAGFETDPRDTGVGKPSAFCYALGNTDTKYIRLLYDYACSCPYLLGKSVRNADDTTLETLKKIQSILKRDVSQIRNCHFDLETEERVLVRLEYFLRFVEFQDNIASESHKLRKELDETRSSDEKKKIHEKIIVSCLNSYLKFCHYKIENSRSISKRFNNYLKFSEFYEDIDNFAFLYFFDNIFLFKFLSMGIKEENKFLNIEWKMLSAMMSSRYFSKFHYSIEFRNKFDGCCSLRVPDMCTIFNFLQYISRIFTKECFKMHLEYKWDMDILQCVPFFSRNALEGEINNFIKELNNKNFESLGKDINPIPEILDELLIIRLQKYIEAALYYSPQDVGMKAVLAIERAVHVIGESIKPPSISGCVVSYLLSACLSKSLWHELTNARNTLSHFRSNSVYGRMELEKDYYFFNGVRSELEILRKSFDIIAFTQKLRVEDTLMFRCIQELEKYGLSKNTIRVFEKECDLRRDSRRIEYKEYHGQCKMLFVDMVRDLQENLQQKPLLYIEGQLKAIDYLFSFISNHSGEEEYGILLRDFKGLTEKYSAPLSDDALNEIHIYLSQLLLEYQYQSMDSLKDNVSKSMPKIQELNQKIKLKQFNKIEIEYIQSAIREAYDESEEARNSIKNMFKDNMLNLEFKEREKLLKRMMMHDNKINKLRKCFEAKDSNTALKYLKQTAPSKEDVEKNVKEMLDDDSNKNIYQMILLLKLTFQSKLNENIYDNASLSEELADKLINFLMKKSNILINRLEALKKILITDDDEIEANWKRGRRSAAIKHHNRFLMRQRYMREMDVQASLEMGFLDCLCVLNQKDLSVLFEKSTNLFSGANLSNIIAHRCSVPERIGEILDETDFPSAIISKILKLIRDSGAIVSMTELFKISGNFDKESFIYGVESDLGSDNPGRRVLIETIKKCVRWKRYLSLLPFP